MKQETKQIETIEKLLDTKATLLGFLNYTQLVVDQEWDAIDQCNLFLINWQKEQDKAIIEGLLEIVKGAYDFLQLAGTNNSFMIDTIEKALNHIKTN